MSSFASNTCYLARALEDYLRCQTRQFSLKRYKEYEVLKIISPGKTNSIDIAQGQASVALESYLKSDTEL